MASNFLVLIDMHLKVQSVWEILPSLFVQVFIVFSVVVTKRDGKSSVFSEDTVRTAEVLL